MFTITQNENHIQYNIQKFDADTYADVESAPTTGITPGSEIFCIENSKTYIFTPGGTWVEK